MKTSVYVRLVAAATIAMAPFAAYSQESDTTQACVDAFVAQNFPGQTPVVKIERNDSLRLPLAFGRSTSAVKLTAAQRETGRVLVTATCTEKNGVVRLTPENRVAVIAAR